MATGAYLDPLALNILNLPPNKLKNLKTVGKGHFLMTLKMAYSQRTTRLSKLKPKTLRAAYFYQMKFHSMIFCPRES